SPEPEEQPWHSDEGLPDDGELGTLLRARDVDPNAAGGVAARITGTRLVANPCPRAEVVEVSGRQREVHGVLDLARAVRAERCTVERLVRLPRRPTGAVRGGATVLGLNGAWVGRAG